MVYWVLKIAKTQMKDFLLISFCLLALACSKPNVSKIPYYNDPDFNPMFLSEPEAEKKLPIASTTSVFTIRTVQYLIATYLKEKYMSQTSFLRGVVISARK